MEATAGEGPGPAAPPTPRRLYRRRHDRVLGGVAGGLGDYFDIDPVVFRIAFVVAALGGGMGVLAYLAAWLLIPEAPAPGEPPPPPGIAFKGPKPWIGIVLLVIGTSLLLGQFGFWQPGVLWGLGFIGLGVALFLHESDRRHESPPPPPPASGGGGPSPGQPSPGPAAPPADTVPTAHPPTGYPPSPAPAGTMHPPSVPLQPRESSVLGWVTVAAAFVCVGILGILDTLGTMSLAGYQLLAIGLAVLGAGLMLGAWIGRSRGLVVLGLLLVPVVLTAGLVRVPLTDGYGQRLLDPASPADLRPEYRLTAGEMVLDLSDYPFDDEPVDLDATVGAGRIQVVVPRGIATRVEGSTTFGSVNLFGRIVEGDGVTVTRTVGGPAPVLDLDLTSSIGEVVVTRPPDFSVRSGGSNAAQVDVNDDLFSPREVTVSKGTTVQWINQGGSSHTVTSDPNATQRFDSGNLDSGQGFETKFTKPGNYYYYCEYHGSPRSGMWGVVRVEPRAGGQGSDQKEDRR